MKNNNIVLIGPVYPYKGGISHYTGLLYRALSKQFRVFMVSYKMQYPKLLMKREQKDFANDSFKVENTDYAIHTANPFNWFKIANKIKKLNPELIIFQWWHPYFSPCYYIMARLLKRYKIMFTCHNVFPHERFPLDRFLTKLVLRQGDCYIIHSKTEAEDLCAINPNAEYQINMHPTYNAFKFEDMSKDTAKKLLNITTKEKVLLFFGYVRKYKGLKYLIKAMKLIKEEIPEIKLFVVGDFDGNKDEYMELIKEEGVDDCIEVKDGYTPDKEVEKYFAGSDLVVLPYESATQSGIVQIAYGFLKPVIVTGVGGLPEVVIDGKTGYIVPVGDEKAITEAVLKFFHDGKESEFIENIKAEDEKYSWSAMVSTISRLCKLEEG